MALASTVLQGHSFHWRWLEEKEMESPGCGPSLIGRCRPIILAWGNSKHEYYVIITSVSREPPPASNNEQGQFTEGVLQVDFPVPTPMQVVEGAGRIDPFCPPFIPQSWIDALCRKCPERYTGCWDHPYENINMYMSKDSAESLRHRVALSDTLPDLGIGVDPAVKMIMLLKHCCSESEYAIAIQTLQRMAANLLLEDASASDRAKYRLINLDNTMFWDRLGRFPGGIEVLFTLGFTRTTDFSHLVLSTDSEFSYIIQQISSLLTSILLRSQS